MAFPSFGYIVGFVVAAAVAGALARRGVDRTVLGTIGLMVVGNLVIYAIGLPWLMAALGVDLSKGLEYGVTPFLIGDALKIALAAGLLPATWRLICSSRRGRPTPRATASRRWRCMLASSRTPRPVPWLRRSR
jgi:biotin transport system substrate-specific component